MCVTGNSRLDNIFYSSSIWYSRQYSICIRSNSNNKVSIPIKENSLSPIQEIKSNILDTQKDNIPLRIPRDLETLLRTSSWSMTSPSIVLESLESIISESRDTPSNLSLYRCIEIAVDTLRGCNITESIELSMELEENIKFQIMASANDFLERKPQSINEALISIPYNELRQIISDVLYSVKVDLKLKRSETIISPWQSSVMRKTPCDIHLLVNMKIEKLNTFDMLSIDMSDEFPLVIKSFFSMVNSRTGILSELQGVLREEREIPTICYSIIRSKVDEFWNQYSNYELNTKKEERRKRSQYELMTELPEFITIVNHKLWGLALMSEIENITEAQLRKDLLHIGDVNNFRKLSLLPNTMLPERDVLVNAFNLQPGYRENKNICKLYLENKFELTRIKNNDNLIMGYSKQSEELEDINLEHVNVLRHSQVIVRDPHIRWVYRALRRFNTRKRGILNSHLIESALLSWVNAIQLTKCIALPSRPFQSWLRSIRRSKTMDFIITRESLESMYKLLVDLDNKEQTVSSNLSTTHVIPRNNNNKEIFNEEIYEENQPIERIKIKEQNVILVIAPNSCEIVHHLKQHEMKRTNSNWKFIAIDNYTDFNFNKQIKSTNNNTIITQIEELNLSQSTDPIKCKYANTWIFPDSEITMRMSNHISHENTNTKNKKEDIEINVFTAINQRYKPSVAIVIDLPRGMDIISPLLRKCESMKKYLLIGTRDQGSHLHTWGRELANNNNNKNGRPIRKSSRLDILESCGWKLDGEIYRITKNLVSAYVDKDKDATGERGVSYLAAGAGAFLFSRIEVCTRRV